MQSPIRAALLLVVSLWAFAAAPAFAVAINFTPGTGDTISAVTCGSDKCPKDTLADSGGGDVTDTTNHAIKVTAPASPLVTNPTSTLTLTSTTTAYTAGQLIANNATAGSITVPSFAIANSAGGAMIPRLRLSTNDATSTAWGGKSIQVDLWTAAPTFSTGDRTTFTPATGTASHLGSYSCTMSAEYGDGAYAECAPNVGSFVLPKLGSGTAIYWTLIAVTGSGVTGASKVWTVTAELEN
jgi:hypothetical protein